MNRRDILRLAFLGAVALGAAALGVVLRSLRGPRATGEQVAPAAAQGSASPLAPADPESFGPQLRKKFDYLSIDDAVIEAYVRDRRRTTGGRRLVSSKEYQRFLLSTDFFQNGADESRPLRYVSLFDAYASPCYQPLARIADA